MLPRDELGSELLRNGVLLDKAHQKALAEHLHDRFAVPGREGIKAAIVRETAVGQEKATVRMPLDEIAAASGWREEVSAAGGSGRVRGSPTPAAPSGDSRLALEGRSGTVLARSRYVD